MDRLSNQELAGVWQKHLERQPRSGLSIEKYCRREGIAPGTYYAWKRRLKSAQATTTPTRRKSKSSPDRSKPARSQTTGGFIHVPLPVSATIQIRFVDGTLVSLPRGDLDALATTLRTLRAAQQQGGYDD
jgi:hypothetical protein